MEEEEAEESLGEEEEEDVRLGDKLFAEEEEGRGKGGIQKEVLAGLDRKRRRQLVEKEAPELQGLLEEYERALKTLKREIKPVLEKCRGKSRAVTYLELKQNLLLSYCTFLSYYLLLKAEGKAVKEHPVIFKLTTVKSMLDNL